MGRQGLHPTQTRPVIWGACQTLLAILAALLLGLGLRRLRLRRLGLRRLGLRRVVVTGESMLPTFEPGDRLLLGRTRRLRPGQVVGLPDPRDERRLLIKRIHTVDESSVEVRGDNEGASTDSRHFGLVPRAGLIGRVLYRYAPPGRTGWMPQ
jgi:nickel-type superoxide dismutase maturation protease